MLDAAAGATFADAVVDQVVNTSVDEAIANLAESGLSQTSDNDSHIDAYKEYLAASSSQELVVIDSSVANPETILSDIDPAAQVVFIDAGSDGIEQLADILSSIDNLDALHIISHGEQGQLNLGTSALNEQTMSGEYADELAVIGDALAEHGDILIYGCDFAGGEEGAEAAALLAGLTGADIAASTDDTGAAVHGGDWDLEHAVGDVQTRTIAATSFSGILADTDGDGVDDAFDLDKDGDGILDVDEGVETIVLESGRFPNGSDPVAINGGNQSDLSTGDIFVFPGAFGGFDLRFEVREVNTISATASLSNSGSLLLAGTGDNEISYILYDLSFVESGSVQADPTFVGTNVPITNAEVFIGDIDAQNGRDFSDIGGVNTAIGSIPDSLVVGSDISPFTYPAGVSAADYESFGLTNLGTGNPDRNNPDFGVSALYSTFEFGSYLHGVDGLRGSGNRGAVFAFSGGLPTDTDGDGISNHCDLDSDNDGISDLIESGNQLAIDADVDRDGVISAAEAAAAGFTDTNMDGVYDQLGLTPVDRDGDGLADFLDLDSDNDGIPDVIEAQPTANYVPPSATDTDGDGVLDAWDTNGVHGAPFFPIEDTDGDGTPDYLDQDSDNDGLTDSAESDLTPGADNDGDGIGDGVGASYADSDGTINDPTTGLGNQTGDTTEVGYREVGPTIGVAKEVVGVPVQQADGSFAVTYSVIVENTGSVDLIDLSVIEDTATEFGAAFVSAGNLRIGTPPGDANSSIVLDSAFNGNGNNQFIDNSAGGTILQSGDSFTVLFDVIVNPTSSALDNQVTATGTAVDENGNVFTDPTTGLPLVASDDSDSGADPDDPNAGAAGDTGGSDDPTPLYLPNVGLAKAAGDAVPNGDNFDVEFTLVWENTGNVALDNVTVLDDIATEFGAQFVQIETGSLAVQNFSGTGSAPTPNTAWETGTTASLVTSTGALESGDSFEIVFTVTIDPDAGGTSSSGLENQASTSGEAQDANGNPLTDGSGNPLTVDDDSDNGTDANGDNGTGTSDDPTPIIIPDIAVVKEAVGDPVLLFPDFNYEVTYQLVVENTGNVDLADVSLIDDLATQFGPAFVSAGSLTLITPPADPASSVVIDSAWDGAATTEMIDQSVTNTLAVGDSYTVQFTAEVDPDASGAAAQLFNQANAAGDAVDDSGNPLTDSSGNPLMANDDSDNGADPNNNNGSGSSDDPTPLIIPSDKDWDGVPDLEDADDDNDGILDVDEGLTVEFTGQYNFTHNENSGTATDGAPNTTAPDSTLLIAGSTPTVIGAGLTELASNGNPAPPGNIFEFYLDGATSPDLATAIANDDYVELSFTTQSSFPSDFGFLDSIDHGTFVSSTSGNNFTDYSYGIEVSADGFATPGTLLESNFNVNNGGLGYTYRSGSALNYQLQPGTTYSFRFYIFDDQGAGSTGSFGQNDTVGRVTFDDIYFNVTGSSFTDTDGDGISNHCDLDSDNDGISDLIESGNPIAIAADANLDGLITFDEAAAAGFTDADGDGVYDQLGIAPIDTDGDGLENFLDLDSDDDLIPDAVEAQPTAGYQSPSIGSDADGDGIVDTFDDGTGEHGGNFALPVDSDWDGTPDYIDTDSDNDGVDDATESGLTPDGIDSDGDGIDDAVAPNSYMDTDGIITTTSPDLANEFGDDSEVGFRELTPEIGVAKSIIGQPVAQPDGTFAVTYELVVENTGGIDLANLSLEEDLAAEFGAAFSSAGSLALVAGPTDPDSVVVLDTTWDGSGNTEFIDNSGATGTLLKVGDSYTVQFVAFVNPTGSALDNQVKVSGTAVDHDGNPITDGSGMPVMVMDLSDSGTDPDDPNAGADGDTGGSDDPTPLFIPVPEIGLAKEAGDAVPNGDNFDVTFTLNWENTGNVDLDNVTILDDIAAQFGAQFVTATIDTVSSSAASVAANPAWGGGNTAPSLITHSGAPLAVGDTIQVAFTVTIDPDAGGTSSSGLVNQATSVGEALDEDGNPYVDSTGAPLTAEDESDDGTNTTNGEDDPTPIVIPDISVAKEVFGTPVALPGGNFEVTYQLVIENTGNVDLADVSVVDDLATQFGAAFVSAGSLTIVTPPADPDSIIAVDAGWDGNASAEMVDQAAATLLSVGDSFTVQFIVEVDPDATGTSSQLDNQATATGDAVDENGNPLTDSSGNPLVVTDDSDNGADPNSENGEGTSDDPTPLLLPDVGLAKSAGDAIPNGDNFNIPFTFVYENTGTVDLGNLSLTDDIGAEFGNAFVGVIPGSLTVQNFTGTGTSPGANAAWEADTSLDLLDGTGQANVGDSFEVTFVVEIDPDGIDSVSQGLENQGTAGGDGDRSVYRAAGSSACCNG